MTESTPRTFARTAASAAVFLILTLGAPHAALAKGGGHSSGHSASHSSHSSHSTISRSYHAPSSTSSRSSGRRSSSAASSRSSSSARPSVSPATSRSTVTRSTSTRRSSSRSRSSRRSSSRSGSSSGSSAYEAPPPPPTVYHTRTVSTSPEPVYYSSVPEPVYYSSPQAAVVTPPSATDQAFHDGLWAGRLEAVFLAGGAVYLADRLKEEGRCEKDDEDIYAEELSLTHALMRELQTQFQATDPLAALISAPFSGRYTGDSAEDDDGDQDVVTHLVFENDGTVRGWGEDGVDGTYNIRNGRWSPSPDQMGGARVAWVETYDDGFEVALRGQVRKSDGALLGMWASSRGISGSVKLESDRASR